MVGYACFLIFQALHKGVRSASKALGRPEATRLPTERAERLAQEQHRAAAERTGRENPVTELVGIPNPDAYRRAFTLLDEYAAAANAYRPTSACRC